MDTKAVAQMITPELRQWLVAQAESGRSPKDTLEAMKTSGWSEDVAVEAMQMVLQAHLTRKLFGVEPAPLTARAQPAAAASVGPDIDTSASPLYVDGGDRRVGVLAVLNNPRVVVLQGLLSDEECEGLIEAARPRMQRSLTVQTTTGGEELNDVRTSNGMFFNRGESELTRRIEARIARLVRWPVENGEGIQVLQYRPGAEYKPHYDYFDPAAPGTPTILARGGQRNGTVVMYLNEPEGGGGTTFPDIGLEVAPRRGNAVFFAYHRPEPASRTLHGGAPVVAGEKWIATKWLRERVFT